MHRELLSNPHIGAYSALLLLGLFGGYLLARWRAVRHGVKGSHLDNLILLVAVMSLFGARFFSWWFYFPPGISLWKALTTSGGGMVFYGGMIFGMAAVILYSRVARLSLGHVMDVCAPGVALGLAFGRVGCFMAGCCWGDLCVGPEEMAKTPSSQLAWQIQTVPAVSRAGFLLAVRFPPATGAYEQHQKLGLIDEAAERSRPVHPVQLYEAVLALALCLALHRWFNRRAWHGQVACALALGYAAIRFITEFLRGDNAPAYWGFTLSQIISLVMATVALGFLLNRKSTTSAGALQPLRVR
jgi:phosphatidylglycerol---prolipoprotein diacylglyceryl transferase